MRVVGFGESPPMDERENAALTSFCTHLLVVAISASFMALALVQGAPVAREVEMQVLAARGGCMSCDKEPKPKPIDPRASQFTDPSGQRHAVLHTSMDELLSESGRQRADLHRFGSRASNRSSGSNSGCRSGRYFGCSEELSSGRSERPFRDHYGERSQRYVPVRKTIASVQAAALAEIRRTVDPRAGLRRAGVPTTGEPSNAPLRDPRKGKAPQPGY